MNDPTVSDRVSTAKRLLEGGTGEYDQLPPGCQAYLQEAIEFLTQVEAGLQRPERKPTRDGQTRRSDTDCWPTFELDHTFTPDADGNRFRSQFEPDDVVIFDPARTDSEDGRWLSSKRDASLSLEELR